MTDREKQAHVLPARVESKRIAALNDEIGKEVKRLRVTLGAMKQKLTTERFAEKATLEKHVRVVVAERESQERALQAAKAVEKPPEEIVAETSAGDSLNHICHLRGWKFPADEYKQVKAVKGAASCDYTCIMRFNMGDETQEIEGQPCSKKQDARLSCIKAVVLTVFPECDTFEECQTKIYQEQQERKAKRGGKPGWRPTGPSSHRDGWRGRR